MDRTIDHNSPVPLHAQVEAYLRELIRQEEYRNGALLPNELALSKQFGISRNTFRSAMDRLVLEGLVVRKKGIGSRVNTAMLTTTLTEWDSFSREMTTKGRVLRTIAKEISWVNASDEVAAAMDIEPGARLCCLKRVKGV
ncbi:MAG TPA: GntR family transcriptional regulator, partial [Clostridia bacterium]|nr:GntR family transcriptional regulator [Clostridia bacterium]